MTDVQAGESLDLYKRLVDLLYSVGPAERRRAHWAMSSEWSDKLADYADTVLLAPRPVVWTELLGLPFEVDDSYGFPQLVVPYAETAEGSGEPEAPAAALSPSPARQA
jgi:hypothetical protein